MKKLIKRRRLDKLSIWRACQLGKFGGFTHRYIASVIFEKPLKRVTHSEICCVSSCLYRHGVKLMDWRNGITVQASVYAEAHIRPKKRQLKLLVAA